MLQGEHTSENGDQLFYIVCLLTFHQGYLFTSLSPVINHMLSLGIQFSWRSVGFPWGRVGTGMVSCHRGWRVGSGGCGSGVNVEGRSYGRREIPYRWRKARRDMKDR